MTFQEGFDIDPDRVSSGPGMGGKVALGGGIGGVVLVVALLLLGGNPGSVLGQFTGGRHAPGQTAATPEHCHTGADANRYVDCRVVATAQSLDAVWSTELPNQARVRYVPPRVRLFTAQVATGCGNATSAVGPFYCPADQTAYFDVNFFQELTDKYGASDGPLAQEYVVAHEFGHHIQRQLGTTGRAQRDPHGAESQAVRTELQADCYAGVWAYHADKTPAPGSDKMPAPGSDKTPGTGGDQPFLQTLSPDDVKDALSAAAAVGDDRIQRAAQGRVNPESWTHGSSQQRQQWFLAGYSSGRINACDTFAARDLNNTAR